MQSQFKHKKPEAECNYGGHLNFETYGNLKSSIWRENKPFPADPSAIVCDVAYGARLTHALLAVWALGPQLYCFQPVCSCFLHQLVILKPKSEQRVLPHSMCAL